MKPAPLKPHAFPVRMVWFFMITCCFLLGNIKIDGGKVSATVKAHGRGKKVEIVKFRRRKHHRKQMGHRQSYTEIEITGISA